MPGQVVDYVRVSTVDQIPERQFIAIQAAFGAEPDRWFTDRSSGGSTDRQALAAMLAHVRDQDASSSPRWTASHARWSTWTSSSAS